MRRAVHVRQGGPLPLLVLALLLAGGSLGALAPPAAAQASTPAPEVCFQTDADGNPETDGLAFRCMADLPRGPDYLQGDFVDIQIQGSPVGAYVRIRCLTSCHETAGKSYFAQYAPGATVRFPRDFRDPMGDNAVADRAPRYNSSWEAVVLLGNAVVARGTFNVWLFDRFTSPGLTVMPGERHGIRASGFDEGANVQLALERRDRDGKWVALPTPSGSLVLFTSGGFNNHVYFPNAWVVPKDEAGRIAECGADRDGCYRFVVKGAGKADEVVPFRVAPATLVAASANSVGNVVHPDGADPQAVSRTREIHVAVDLHYPGGRSFQGEAFAPGDVKPSPITNEPTLRGRVERVNVTATLPIQDLAFRYAPQAGRWEATWTIPKDFPLRTAEPDAKYRIRLLPDNGVEKWGNLVPEVVLAEHVVDRATLRPAIFSGIAALPRTEEGNFTFDVRYLNGTPLAASDLAAPLRGCFYVASQGDPLNCARAGLERVDGAYENGKWVFRVRFPRAYASLEDHRFHLAGNVDDRWGNTVQEADAGPFAVTPASPRVAFSTILRGRDLQTLERGGGAGNYVSVQAVVTYADGSAFNHAVTPNASVSIPGTLTRRSPEGVVISQTRYDLREVDPQAGRWAADLVLTADDTETPLGAWTFRFDVRDNLTVPNANATSFERTIVGIPLLIDPVRQPFGLVETDTVQTFRFRVLYQDGHEVPRGDLLEGLQAYVHRYNPANQTAYGPPVSTRLAPQHDAESGWYQADFRIPANLFSGTYVFVVGGRDRHGNALAQDAYSREFGTTSRTLERPVITQPPVEAMRGESATVVFDAREGDVGVGGTGAPALRIERFDASAGAWVVERADARQTAPNLLDHVGLFPITLTTPVGLYRFTLEGRDANLQRIVATSQNFTVLPTDVPRVLFTPPPERVTKGAPFSFSVERQEGDRILEVQVLLNGRAQVLVNGQPYAMPTPVLVPAGTFVNVTWQVPFEAPSGNYTLRFGGRDLYGNRLDVLTPAIEAEPAQLTGRLLGAPSRTVARNEEVSLLFGITYPTGAYYQAPQPPVVQVVNDSGFVAAADVRPDRLTYVATWKPRPDVPAGEYRFEVTGTGAGGNPFPSLRSAPFRVVPGAVTRPPAQDVGSAVERMATAVFSVPFDPQDRDVEFLLAYHGPTTDASPALFDTRDPLTTTLLAHVLEPATSRYVARFVTDQQTPPGMYRILMRATDGHGNDLSSKSNPFLLSPTSILLVPDPSPPDDAFQEGVPITLSFVARYRSGSLMEESNGRPSAVILYTAPGRGPQPVTDRPQVEYRDGRWYATWTPPEKMPEGVYEFSFGGADDAGNTIASSKSRAYVVTTTIGGSAAKLLPGPGAEHALVALAGVALALGARRRR
jgi:hypothetical protein